MPPSEAERIIATVEYLRATGVPVTEYDEFTPPDPAGCQDVLTSEYLVPDVVLSRVQRVRLFEAGFERRESVVLGIKAWRWHAPRAKSG
jgi:hypothetical protein